MAALSAVATTAAEKPNILWITSEDNTVYLGCYGDKNARTPNLDSLAASGVRFANCFANAPVCAVARSSWLRGMPAVSTGTHHMRSRYRVPEELVPYPTLLKEAGYYITNNSKTDYNSAGDDKSYWDECSRTAHYKNRPEGKPFFAIFNTTISHESGIFQKRYEKDPASNPTTPAPEKLKIPPYQVKTPEVIRDWQRVYQRVNEMDTAVGAILQELEALGEADNTIVFYCSDHGGITLRSKRFLHDSGTRVPFMIRVPGKWKQLAPIATGSVSQRLAQFVDMPKTFLALAGAEVPDRMPGRILTGPGAQAAEETVFLYSGRFDECPDMSRAVSDGRWKYIRNYEPDRPRFQMLNYPRNQAGQVSQWLKFKAGRTTPMQSAQFLPQPPEELYDTEADPHEVKNLVGDKRHAKKLAWMREQLDEHMLARRDLGLIPEPLMAAINEDESTTIYEFGQSDARYPLKKLLKAANLAALKDPKNMSKLKGFLKDENPIMRYWGIVGLRVLGEGAAPAQAAVKAALEDDEASVRINAAITLGNLGQRRKALEVCVAEARAATTDAHALWALDGIKYLDAPEAIKDIPSDEITKGGYSKRTLSLLASGGSMNQAPSAGPTPQPKPKKKRGKK